MQIISVFLALPFKKSPIARHMPNKQQLTGRHIVLRYGDQFSACDLLELNKVVLSAARRVNSNFCAKRLWAEFVFYQLVSGT